LPGSRPVSPAASSAADSIGDPAAGKAQAAACGACHGQDGATGIDPSYPNLAGQNERYLLTQLEMIQANTRNIPLMAGQLTGKSEQDLANLAGTTSRTPPRSNGCCASMIVYVCFGREE